MAVKDGLPATDFSRKDREWVKNVVDGTTVPNGLPATDLSRMNREWVKAIVDEAGGGGGEITVESLSVTENGTYTADEGKAYSPVTVNVPLGIKATLVSTYTFAEDLNSNPNTAMPTIVGSEYWNAASEVPGTMIMIIEGNEATSEVWHYCVWLPVTTGTPTQINARKHSASEQYINSGGAAYTVKVSAGAVAKIYLLDLPE